MKKSIAIFIKAAGLSLAGLAGPAWAHNNDMQVWFTESAATALDDQTNIGLDLSERLREERVGEDQFLARLLLDRHISKAVQLGVGFAWKSTGGQNEYRPHQQLSLSFGQLGLRTRLEERWIDGADRMGVRLRQRALWSVPLDQARQWSAIIEGEAFFQLNRMSPGQETGLAAYRTQLGLQRRLTQQLSVSLVYQRQQTIVSGGEDSVSHMPLLTIGMRF